jgi:hypothetical protein
MTSYDHIDPTTEGEDRRLIALNNQIEAWKVQKDILWGLYEEHRAHARHTETLRSTVNSMLIVASAALVTLATYDKKLNSWDIPAALLLIGFGFLGFLFSLYHTEKIVKHKIIADGFRRDLDETVFTPLSGAHLNDIGARNAKWYPTLSEDPEANKLVTFVNRFVTFVIVTSENMKIRSSFVLWAMLPSFIAAIGLLLLVIGFGFGFDPLSRTDHS